MEYNVWWPSSKISTFNLDDVEALNITRKFQENDIPFFDRDNSRRLTKLKNDSLKNMYATGSATILHFIAREKTGPDIFYITPGACYHIYFKDGTKTAFGIVERITEDSIYITSHISTDMAVVAKEPYNVYRYRHSDISALRLAKSDGFSAKMVNIGDYIMAVRKVEKTTLGYPGWYAWSTSSGEINFYRPWLMFNGYRGITETAGRAVWYEGEPKE